MKPAAFRYHAPKTVDEAVALLAEVAPEDGRVLAGGQSLVPTMAFRLAKPAHLVDINGVEALDRLAVTNRKLVIGACVRHAAFHRAVCDGPLGKLLSDVVRHIAHYPIRNRDPPERLDPVDVNQMGGLREAKRHGGHQALPAGQHAAVLRGDLGQDGYGFFDRFRRMIAKRRRLHRLVSTLGLTYVFVVMHGFRYRVKASRPE